MQAVLFPISFRFSERELRREIRNHRATNQPFKPPFLPWREPEHYRLLLNKLPQTVGIGTLLRDREGRPRNCGS